jgi:hypothetical protein
VGGSKSATIEVQGPTSLCAQLLSGDIYEIANRGRWRVSMFTAAMVCLGGTIVSR